MLPPLSPKRRLKVLQSTDDPDAPPRPRWQWVVFGALAILTAWLPLAYAAEALSGRIVAERFATFGRPGPSAQEVAEIPAEEQARMSFALWVLPTMALALAATAGGYVLGRWGERGATREAAEAGAVAALLPVVLVGVRSGVTGAALGVLVVAVPFAVLGAYAGRRRRSARLT